MGRQSREALAVESSEISGNTVSFGRKNGCFVSRSFIMLTALLFVTCLVATGLLVYFFSGNKSAMEDGVQYEIVHSSSTSMMKPTKTEKKIDVRLPLDIMPLHYYVRLKPYINGNFNIHGYVEFTFKVVKKTDKIILHINDLITFNDTTMVYPMGGKSSTLRILSQTFDQEREFYIAKVSPSLKVGEKYVIAMEYEAYLNDDMDGFYRSSYEDENGIKRWIAATQFQPTDARKAFPCLDEPGIKANFTIDLGRQENMTSISNMPLKKTIPMDDSPGWVWDKFETSVPMSTYLVAFAVTDFNHLESHGEVDYQFRVWARKTAINQAEYSIKIGPPISKFFEEFFKIPYPLPKQDMIALPDFSAGAMENWGLITYRETAMLYDPKMSKASDKFYVGYVIAHELAHQWFGNLVTPSWWTDLWLNEGFASYLEYIGLNAVEPSFKALDQFVVIDLQSVFRLDCLESSHPISIPVGHPSEINEIFDRISYSKGASIIRMMSHFLTEETFRKGLTNYLNKFAYDAAAQDDLWHHLTQQAHKDNSLSTDLTVKMIMDTWTLQMGFPVITAKRGSDGSITVMQKRFLLVKSENSTDTHDYKWWVPITYTTEQNRDFQNTKPMTWMKPSEEMKTISGVPSNGWYIINVQQTGYYRVNYEESNWKAIIAYLQSNPTQIGAMNKAQLLDDALSLSRAGLLDYKISMSILSYLNVEDDYIPWRAALNNLGFIKNMFQEKGGYGSLNNFLLSLITPMYGKLGFKDNLNDSYLEQRLRSMILGWACSLDHPPCIEEAKKIYKLWMQNPSDNTIISPNLRSIVYCTAIANGGIKEWKFAWERYEEANLAAEKLTLLRSMGCSKKTWILKGLLERGLIEGKGIRKQDYRSVLSAVAGNPVGKPIAWEFVKDRWNDILDFYGRSVSFTLGSLVKSVTAQFNTRIHLKEFMAFKEEHKKDGSSAKRAIDQAIENAKNNLAWMDKHYHTIHQWLLDNKYDNSI